MARDWRDYQEEVAGFFRSLGIQAETNVVLEGVRGRHTVDVLARPVLGGQAMMWVVECKLWRTRVPKEKVLVLQSIVHDVGADRGYLMAENGYQSGALRAALVSNVVLKCLGDLRETAEYDLDILNVKSDLERAVQLQTRYWHLGKEERIAGRLRPEAGMPCHSARAVLNEIIESIGSALTLGFPVSVLQFAVPYPQLGVVGLATPGELHATARPAT